MSVEDDIQFQGTIDHHLTVAMALMKATKRRPSPDISYELERYLVPRPKPKTQLQRQLEGSKDV
jgi:hypothetical protein